MENGSKRLVAALAFGVCLSGAQPVLAETLQDAVADMLVSHDRILAAGDDRAAAKERIEETWGLWYPTLNVTGN